jgi:hypothetical protein
VVSGDDLATLQARVDRLERLVNAVTPGNLLASFRQQEAHSRPPVIAPPEAPVPLRVLAVANRLGFDNIGDARVFIESVALAKGAAPVAQECPGEWSSEIVAVKQARETGKSWAEALRAAGLEPPSDTVILEQVQAIRRESNGFHEVALGLYRAVIERYFWRSPFGQTNLINDVAGLLEGSL